MLVSFAPESTRARLNGQILANLLEQQGPLALDLCLRYATEIAMALRELHESGRAHGGVDATKVVLRAAGAELSPPDGPGYADPLADLIGFGAVLYAMLTGKKPCGDEFRLAPPKPVIFNGPAAVRAAATRLAERCLTAERETAPELQKILTEVRLLSVMTKQFSAEQIGALIPLSPPLLAFPASAVIDPPAIPEAPAPPADPHTPDELSDEATRDRESQSRPVLSDVMCPKCKGFHVRLSRPRTGFERLLNLFGVGVYRCHRCFYRYIPFFGRKVIRKAQ